MQVPGTPNNEASAAASAENVVTPDKANELQHAFDLFNQVSAELTQAYEALQQRVVSLTAELAVANGELRKQYLEKQALSERLTLLLNALPAGVLVVDGDGRVSEANPAARVMFGADLSGMDWAAALAPRLLPTGAPDEWMLAAGPAGVPSPRRVHLVSSPLPTAGGRIVLLHDITATHDMKASLERNRRLAAMGEMAASLAHQLRTPLSTALLYSANLAKPDLSDEARARFADRAAEQLKRLERLIQDVLLFARGESIGREVIAVGPWLADIVQTVEPLYRSRGVDLGLSATVGDAVVVGGRKALTGAFINLLENALQVSERGARVQLTASLAAGALRFSVRDQGPGVAPEMRTRIFEPFYTTRGQGTGLGLAIALGVARAHGGTIEVAGAEGEAGEAGNSGAEFVFSLPAGRPDELLPTENQ